VPRRSSREAALTEVAFLDPPNGGARAEAARKKKDKLASLYFFYSFYPVPLCSTLVVARTASRLSVARKVKILYAATGTSNKSPLAFWWWSLLPRSLVHRLSVLFFFLCRASSPFFLCFSVRSTPLLSPRAWRRGACVTSLAVSAVPSACTAGRRWWMERKGVACRAETSEKYSPRGGRLGKQCFAAKSTACPLPSMQGPSRRVHRPRQPDEIELPPPLLTCATLTAPCSDLIGAATRAAGRVT
jgi:hypothetical protein